MALMGPDDFILAILAAIPGRRLKGKKRLQKLAFLLTQAGAKCEAEFHIRDFGPFSAQIANATKFLAAIGLIDEREEPVGAANTYVSTFKLSPAATQRVKPLNPKYQKILRNLEKYPTVDLEVAATIIFFQAMGLRGDVAIRKTKELKPTKTTAQVLKKLPAIAECLRSA
jgi:uncharacterized protein YwgA